MTLEEQSRIICAWMESRPEPNTHGGTFRSGGNWWYWSGAEWIPRDLTLNELCAVERILTLDQRDSYVKTLMWDMVNPQGKRTVRDTFGLINASAVQKLAALASVLQGVK